MSRRAIHFLLALFAIGSLARACSIPVFRYALDRWPADPYALSISASDASDEAVARFLRNFTDSTPINVKPVRSKEDGPSRLDFPHAAPGAAPMWSGKLDGATLPRIVDSPARAEVVKRILAGEAAVWVLVNSGDAVASEQAAALVEKRLRYLEQVAQLPVIDPNDPTSRLGPGPALRVKFSLLRVASDAPDEQAFLKMLAGPKAEQPVATGPWLALVFGRGRVLGAWPAAGFGDEQIDEACLFLLGACSCQVKRLNPGWDLLLNADWDESLRAIGYPASEPGAAKTTVASPAPETVTINAEAKPVAPVRTTEMPVLAVLAGAALLLGTAALGGAIFRRL